METPIKPQSFYSLESDSVNNNVVNHDNLYVVNSGISITPLKQHRIYGDSITDNIISKSSSLSCIYGEIQLILGCMFSGKTSELFRRIRRYEFGHKKCFIIKYSADNRYSEKCASTHDQIQIPAVSCKSLSSIDEKQLESCDVLAVDEGAFFSDIVSFSEFWANKGKIILVAALDATYERKPFENIANLIPLAENVTKLTAVCTQCGKEASFSKRITNETGLEVIGGADKYIAACRKCFFKPHSNYSASNTPVIIKRKNITEISSSNKSSHIKQLQEQWGLEGKKPKIDDSTTSSMETSSNIELIVN